MLVPGSQTVMPRMASNSVNLTPANLRTVRHNTAMKAQLHHWTIPHSLIPHYMLSHILGWKVTST